MLTGGRRTYNLHDLRSIFAGLDLYPTDPAQRTTAAEELDDVFDL